MEGKVRRGPLMASGLLLGAGMGGFFDGILFHQILQMHGMLSARVPIDSLASAKVNMAWDGYFHASVWLLTLAGVALLFRAGRRGDALWSGSLLLGAMLAGWGLFNMIEGVLDHLVLGLHHVDEYAANPWPADLAFLAVGLAQLLAGTLMIRNQRNGVR